MSQLEILQNLFNKSFRSDNGREFVNHLLGDFFEDKGIVHQTSCPRAPQQNILVERKNKYPMEVA